MPSDYYLLIDGVNGKSQAGGRIVGAIGGQLTFTELMAKVVRAGNNRTPLEGERKAAQCRPVRLGFVYDHVKSTAGRRLTN
jgi:hypothetical protein